MSYTGLITSPNHLVLISMILLCQNGREQQDYIKYINDNTTRASDRYLTKLTEMIGALC